MRLSTFLAAILLAGSSAFLSLPAFAALNYVAPAETEITRLTGKNVPLAGNKCTVCHGIAGPPMTPFGADLQAVAGNKGYGDGAGASWLNSPPAGLTAAKLFQNLFEGVAAEDSDNDSYDNKTELGAGSNPGSSSSVPGATNDSSGSGGSGDTQILSPRNTNNNGSSSGSTLSGCGQVSQLDQNPGFNKAELGRVWLFALLLLLPMIVLSLLREPKAKAVPERKKGPVPPLR